MLPDILVVYASIFSEVKVIGSCPSIVPTGIAISIIVYLLNSSGTEVTIALNLVICDLVSVFSEIELLVTAFSINSFVIGFLPAKYSFFAILF